MLKPIPGFPLYSVDETGRVWSERAKRFLKPGLSSSGYYTVALGRGNSRCIHDLVAVTFLGPCPDGQEVRHRDGIRAHSWLSNLLYGTRGQNIADAVGHGTWPGFAAIRHLRTPESFAKGWATRRARAA